MSITNTIATYLIFLAYINLTKSEGLISIVAVGHALRAFSPWRLVNKRVLRGRIRKNSSLFFFSFFFFLWSFFSFSFFFFFFFFFFFLAGGRSGTVFSFCCFFLVWLGDPVLPGWIHGATSGLLPDNTGSQWEMSNFWGKGQTIITLFNITKVKPSCGFQTLMLTCTVSWLTALRLIVLHTELAEFYNDNLKDTLNSLKPTWYTIPTSS